MFRQLSPRIFASPQIGLAEVAEESVSRHQAAYGDNPIYANMLDVGGMYQYRLRGEAHA